MRKIAVTKKCIEHVFMNIIIVIKIFNIIILFKNIEINEMYIY